MRFFAVLTISAITLFLAAAAVPVTKDDVQQRVDLFKPILQEHFSNLVQTTLGSISGLFSQFIKDNSLPLGKRALEETDLAARVDALSFLYDNVLSDLFTGLVSNTFNQLSSTLLNLIQTNPLGIGKRSIDQAELAARIDGLSFIYDNVLSDLFTGLVSNTFNHLSSTLLNLIQTNPLGIGKRSIDQAELAARIDGLSFIYDNVLSDLFTGLVSNTFNHLSSTLLNLIQTNPLGIGKRSIDQAELAARIDGLSFLYDNVLSDLFTGLVSNTFNQLSSTLLNLIQTNPLGIGKRSIDQDELAARIDGLSFLYDNVLSDLFTGLVSNTFNQLSSTLLNLIQTNPLGIGKRSIDQDDLAARIDGLSFLYDNVLSDLFTGLVSNTFNHLSSTLLNLIQTNPLGIGKRSVNVQEIENLLAPMANLLTQEFRVYIAQALALVKNGLPLNQLVQTMVNQIQGNMGSLAQSLSHVIPSDLHNQVAKALGLIQTMLTFWTGGLAGSLGPVLGPF